MHAILVLLLLASPPLPVAPAMSKIQLTSAGAVCTGAAASCKVLNGVAATAQASDRTFVLPVAGFSKVSIQVNLTRVAAVDIQLACSASLDGGAHYAPITSTVIATGVGTMTAYHDVYATATTGSGLFEYDSRTYDHMSCVWSSTTGGGTDLATVYAIAAVGQ